MTGNAPAAAGAELEVRGLLERIGDVALAAGVPLYLLAPARASLEEAFMELTADSSRPAGRAGTSPRVRAVPAARRRSGLPGTRNPRASASSPPPKGTEHREVRSASSATPNPRRVAVHVASICRAPTCGWRV